jgi:hypothetical protein
MAMSNADLFEMLMELRQVTERFPTGEIKETVWINEVWVPFSHKIGSSYEGNPDLMICALSTTRSEQLMREGKQTMRRKAK